MAEFFCYEGLRDNGTFIVDTTTATAVKDNPEDIVGKVVTLTGNFTVGYGSSGDVPLGFVAQIEKESTNSDKLVVSVRWNRSQEFVEGTGVTAGDYVACNGTGGVAKSTDPTSARAWGADGDTTYTVYIHG